MVLQNADIVSCLAPFVTEHKRQLIRQVLAERTRHITVVLEEIYQPHNASAVLRSADCFGIQDVHVVESRNRFVPNKEVDMGSRKWLTMHRYRTGIQDAVAVLKRKGYTIVATTPHDNAYTPTSLPLDRPVALLFGTELEGLTPEAIRLADSTLTIPMYGFTESFNISVSVAVILSHLVERLRSQSDSWRLTVDEQEELTVEWYRNIVKQSDLIEQRCAHDKQI